MSDTRIVVLGSRVDGGRYVGPFADHESAKAYAGRQANGQELWIIELHAPPVESKPTTSEWLASDVRPPRPRWDKAPSATGTGRKKGFRVGRPGTPRRDGA